MWLMVLVGCDGFGAADAVAGGVDTTGTGADMPAYCAEDHREAVADSAVAAADFSFALDDVLGLALGSYTGQLTPYQGDSVDLALDVRAPEGGEIWAVYRTFVDPSAGDTGPAMGAASSTTDCPPVYEFSLSVDLNSADGAYGGRFEPLLQVGDLAAISVSAEAPLDTLTGTALPSFDVDKWDTVSLGLYAELQDGAWSGSLLWSGSSDTSDDPEGTVSPSGQTEGVGAFLVAPDGC